MRLTALIPLTICAAMLGASPEAEAGCMTCFEQPDCAEWGSGFSCVFEGDNSYGCCRDESASSDAGTSSSVDSGHSGTFDSGHSGTVDAGSGTGTTPVDSGVGIFSTGQNGNGSRAGSGAFVRRDDCTCVQAERPTDGFAFAGVMLLGLLAIRRRS